MNKDMKKYIQQWLIKANEDILVINRLMEFEIVAKGSICFHCEQAVEKFLKAFLIYNKKDIIKTHNIEFLLSECSKIDTEFKDINPKNLTDYGVVMRYPGDFYEPDIKEVIEYKEMTLKVKFIVENKIKID